MKNVSLLTILGIILCAMIILLAGCGYFAQPGETLAEGRRRHLRNLSINQQNLIADIDMAMLADKPSKLSDRKID